MKFTDPLFHAPKPKPPRSSWWAEPKTREEFAQRAKAEEARIVQNPRFGGNAVTHNKWTEPK